MTKGKDVVGNNFLSGDQKKSETIGKPNTDRVIGESSVDTSLGTNNEVAERSYITVPTESEAQTLPDEASAHTSPTSLSEVNVPSASSVDTDLIRRTVKQRKSGLSEYRATFLPVPKIIDRKPVFVSHTTRDRLDRIVRLFGERGMSVSGLIENIALHHLAIHEADIEYWRKM